MVKNGVAYQAIAPMVKESLKTQMIFTILEILSLEGWMVKVWLKLEFSHPQEKEQL